MKSFFLFAIALWLGAFPCFSQTKAPLKITVDREQKTKYDLKQPSRATQSGDITYYTPQVTEQNREISMNIQVQNLGGSPMTGLVVKYLLFSRDKRTRAIRPVDRGDQTIDLKPLEVKTVRTVPVDFTSRDVNFNQGEFAERNHSTGNEYYGIAVRIYAGDDLVATYFSPPSLDKRVEKMDERSRDESQK